MKPANTSAIIFALLVTLCCPPSQAAIQANPNAALLNLDWRVYLAAKPIYAILVEKARQRLLVLRHDGRPQVVAEYAAATGEKVGPKEKEGDSKTPEGIYLITKAYLDRTISVFGNRAFHLNYPNYFDVQQGRSGTGIYIHGTNKALRLNSSNGCVTLTNSDLEGLAQYLTVGTPVFIVASLDRLAAGPIDYPSLTEHGFAGAKALLLLETEAAADFASLYLIRINEQTLVVGEPWPAKDSAPPERRVAYLQRSPDKRWSAVDRGVAGSGQDEGDHTTVAGLPPELLVERSVSGLADSAQPLPPLPLWQSTPADAYLSLSGYARVPGALSPGEGGATDPLPVVDAEGQTIREGLVYGLFLLATVISVAATLIMFRRQARAVAADDGGRQAGGVSEGGSGQVELLRDEVKQAREALHTLHKRIEEEARTMETQAALQARVKALEEAFFGKQAEIERLNAEQAALKLQGQAMRSDQEEALAALQLDLAAVKQGLDTARQELSVLIEREGGAGPLAAAEPAPAAGQAVKEIVEVCDSLRGQVQALTDALQQNELTRPQDAGEEGRAVVVAEALQAYAAEMMGLHAEVAAIRGAADTSGLEAALHGLRNDLQEERAAKSELLSRLSRMGELEEILAQRDRAIGELRQVSELRQREAAAEKGELEATLAALRQELREVQPAQAAQAEGRILMLEEALAGQERALAAMRQEDEERRVAAQGEKGQLESAIMALRQELQAVQAAKAELAARCEVIPELEEALAGQERGMETMRQELEEQRAVAQGEKNHLESSIVALRQELQETQAAKAELTGRCQRIPELEEALAGQERAQASLRQEHEAQRAAAEDEKKHLESSLAALRQELQEAQAVKAELTGRCQRIPELEEALAGQERAQASLRQEHEAQRAAAQGEKNHLESSLVALHQELQETQAVKAELAGRCARIPELEEALAGQERECETLRAAKERLEVDGEAEKGRLEAAISELVLSRQVEVTGLTNSVQEAREKAMADQETIAHLKKQIETLHEGLLQASDQEQALKQLAHDQEMAVAALEKEIADLKATMAGLEKKVAVSEGVVLMKGSHSLPGDVLRKWIGKEK